jgi:hypothetical protein
MEPTHGLTVHFMDGSKLSYGFPTQSANSAARQIRLEEFLKSSYLLVIADGILTALLGGVARCARAASVPVRCRSARLCRVDERSAGAAPRRCGCERIAGAQSRTSESRRRATARMIGSPRGWLDVRE